MVLVQVRNASSSNEIQLGDLPSDASVQTLMAQVHQRWKVHPRCQKVWFGGRLLNDDEGLVVLVPPNSHDICIEVVVSLTDVTEDLLSQDHDVGKAALEDLKRSRHSTGIAEVVGALTAILTKDDEETHVRRRAADIVGELADVGDEAVVVAFVECLNDDEKEVRHAAVNALCKITNGGDKGVTASLAERFEGDEDLEVRYAAAEALTKLAKQGDDFLVAALIACLQDGDQDIRRFSIELLSTVAEVGDVGVVLGLMARLADPFEEIRFAALHALSAVAVRGDSTVVSAVLPWLQDDVSIVRQAAAHALSILAASGDEPVMAALFNALGDDDDGVRSAAYGAWCQVACHLALSDDFNDFAAEPLNDFQSLDSGDDDSDIFNTCYLQRGVAN